VKQKILVQLILLALLFGVAWWVRQRQHNHLPTPTPTNAQTPAGGTHKAAQPASESGVPTYTLEVLQYIRKNGEAPDGYVGGREFLNREKKLPAKNANSQRIRYSEWDVHPKIQGQNRGAERLVTGSDHSAWYTANHYKSFLKIEE